MAFYRVYEYPNAKVPFKHVYIKRDRNDTPDREKTKKQIIDEKIAEHKKLDNNISRAKRNITDLALCNDFEYFCAFTFNGTVVDRYSMKECSSKLRKFFNNFKSRYAPDFKYLIIPEYHKDGAIHFHGLCAGFPVGELTVPDTILKRNKMTGEVEQVPNTRGYLFWARYDKSLGIFNCSQVKSRNACAFYVQKYVTKDLKKIEKGMPVYMCSKGLQRPELIFDADDIPMMVNPTFENDYVKVAFDMRTETDELMDKNGLLTPWGYAKSYTVMPDEIPEDEAEEIYHIEQMRLDDYGK